MTATVLTATEPLVTSFTDTTFRYDQIERQGNIALFTQTHKESGIVRFEVIRIETKPPYTLPDGRHYPEREVYPPSTQGGKKGWTFFTEVGARHKMTFLLGQLPQDDIDRMERQEWKKRHPGRERT